MSKPCSAIIEVIHADPEQRGPTPGLSWVLFCDRQDDGHRLHGSVLRWNEPSDQIVRELDNARKAT